MNQILLILVFIAGLNPCISLNTRADLFNPFLIFSGETQSLITFSHPIPEKIKLLEKVNFSFYVDQSVISQYRYMIQVPKGSNSGIEERLTQWSPWKFDGIAEILTQSFQNEGNFKFCVEFRQHSSGESKVFEKPLTVRWENPEITGNKFPVDNQYINSGKKEEVFKRAAEEYKKSYDIWFRNFKQSYNGMGLSKQPPEVLIDKLSEQIIKSSREGIINSAGKDISPKSILLPSYVLELIKKGNSDLIMVFRNPQANTAASMASASKAIQSVYTAEYETKSRTFAADTAELAQVEHALKPAGENDLLKGETDPTLKPFVNLQSESNKIQIIEDTSKKKVDYLPQADYDKMPLDSLNEKDNFGNAPLHLAILRGDSEYSELLISKGADINLKNQTSLLCILQYFLTRRRQ